MEDNFDVPIVAEPTVEELQVPSSLKDRTTWLRFGRYQLWYSVLGLLSGILAIFAGTVLIGNGIAGHISWTSKLLAAESNISDAPPGVVLVVVGFMLVYVTRYSVKR
jgi:hypothetical protein